MLTISTKFKENDANFDWLAGDMIQLSVDFV